MYCKSSGIVLVAFSLLSAAMNTDDSLFVRSFLDADGLTEVNVGDVVSWDTETGRIYSLFLANIPTIYGKKLTRLPDDLDRLSEVRYIMANDNALETLPASVGNLIQLSQIDIERNRLTSLPDEIGNCPNLEYINVADNQLETLPAGIGRCPDLYVLNVRNNRISSLPAEITAQTFHDNYTNANFDENYLCDLTGSVGTWFYSHFSDVSQHCDDTGSSDLDVVQLLLDAAGLSQVKAADAASVSDGRVFGLTLSGLGLAELPAGIDKLPMLERLDCSDNALTALPDELSSLPLLSQVDISSNRFQTFPEVLLSCAKLLQVHCGDNDLEGLPAAIIGSGIVQMHCEKNRLCGVADAIAIWLDKVTPVNLPSWRLVQNCPIAEDHPLLREGNVWRYEVTLTAPQSGLTGNVVRDIRIESINEQRDTVITIEHDSGTGMHGDGQELIPVSNDAKRVYVYCALKLQDTATRAEHSWYNLPFLVTTEQFGSITGHSIGELSVIALQSYDLGDYQDGILMKDLCLNDSLGLLSGSIDLTQAVTCTVRLQSFNGVGYDSPQLRQQLDSLTVATPVLRHREVRRQPMIGSGSVKQFDLLGRTVRRIPNDRNPAATVHGIIIEQRMQTGRTRVRLR